MIHRGLDRRSSDTPGIFFVSTNTLTPHAAGPRCPSALWPPVCRRGRATAAGSYRRSDRRQHGGRAGPLDDGFIRRTETASRTLGRHATGRCKSGAIVVGHHHGTPHHASAMSRRDPRDKAIGASHFDRSGLNISSSSCPDLNRAPPRPPESAGIARSGRAMTGGWLSRPT